MMLIVQNQSWLGWGGGVRVGRVANLRYFMFFLVDKSSFLLSAIFMVW